MTDGGKLSIFNAQFSINNPMTSMVQERTSIEKLAIDILNGNCKLKRLQIIENYPREAY